MISPRNLEILLGLGAGLALVPLALGALRAVTVSVAEGAAALVTRFGRHTATLDRPGLHLVPSKLLPWVGVRTVSLRRSFRDLRDVHVNDARGTTVLVDLWLELRVTDPVKAAFSVADLERSLVNLVTHAAISTLGSREFQEILTDRSELGAQIARDVQPETERWGVRVEALFIHDVSLLPDVSRQVFERIAAELERAKAEIEEDGRQGVALLEARTSERIASLVAEAKGEYPRAMGRVFSSRCDRAAVLDAYEEIYGLALRRPHRTIVFEGFGGDGALTPMDAVLAAPSLVDMGQDGEVPRSVGSGSVHGSAHGGGHGVGHGHGIGHGHVGDHDGVHRATPGVGPTHGAGRGAAHFGGAVPHGHGKAAHFEQGHTPGYRGGCVCGASGGRGCSCGGGGAGGCCGGGPGAPPGGAPGGGGKGGGGGH